MHLNILILIKTAKKHTQWTLFACYNTPYLTDLKKVYSLLTEHSFFTRKINKGKLWFLLKIVCIGRMYFSEMIIIKDGKDIPNGPFRNGQLSIHTCCVLLKMTVYCNIHR